MGTYNSAVITNGGQSMIAQAVAGASLEFTTIKTSNYAYPAGTNLATLTTINGIKQSKDITSAAVYNSRVIKISAAVDNTGISTAYTINTIGIYAKVGSSAESLFAVVTASAADTMPAYDSKPYSYIYEINLTMQNAANVTVTVNAAGLINVTDLNAAKVEIRGEIADLKSHLDAAVTEIVSKNIFDTSNKTVGKYLNPNSGTYASNDAFSTTDYIPVLGSENYMFAYDNDRTVNTEPYYFYCWYDESKAHISGGMHTGAATSITSPGNAKYIRLSYSNSFESYIQFERGDTKTEFVAHQTNAIKIRKNAHYTVVSGTPSTTLLELCEIARNATEDNPYIVELAEGTYNALDGYTNSAKTATGFKGLTVPNYTTIKGTGKKENTIIQCVLSTKDQNISTLNLAGTASLENLTIVGEKTRYAIHDDFSYSDGKCYRRVVNCDIIVTDAYYGSAYGSGVRSGARWHFKDVLFQSNNGEAFTIHSNVNFDNYADVTLENCTIKTKARMGVRIGAMSSGVLNRIHFIGCTLSGIRVMEEQHDACGVDWIVDGHGNTPNILWSYVYTDGGEYYPEFSDETVYLKCAGAINKNDPVYRDAENVVKVRDSRKAFIGVALKTGVAGDIIPIKTKGNVCIDDWSIASGVVKSDYMSLNNGAFVVDNTISDPIGIISNTAGYKEMLLCGLQNR